MATRKPGQNPAPRTQKTTRTPAAQKKAAGAAASEKPKPVAKKAPQPARKVKPQSSQPEHKRRGGRPSDFEDEFVEQARKLAVLGATDIEIADILGVSVRTVYRWKASVPAFCQALKVGKAEADDRVERSLFSRANGYEHDEMDIRVVNGEIVQTPIRKYYPPDTTAAIFWLKNRRPDLWREKVEAVHTGPGGGPMQVQTTVTFVRPPERTED